MEVRALARSNFSGGLRRTVGAKTRPEYPPPTTGKNLLYVSLKTLLTSSSSSLILTIFIMEELNSELIFTKYQQTLKNPTLPHINWRMI